MLTAAAGLDADATAGPKGAGLTGEAGATAGDTTVAVWGGTEGLAEMGVEGTDGAVGPGALAAAANGAAWACGAEPALQLRSKGRLETNGAAQTHAGPSRQASSTGPPIIRSRRK